MYIYKHIAVPLETRNPELTTTWTFWSRSSRCRSSRAKRPSRIHWNAPPFSIRFFLYAFHSCERGDLFTHLVQISLLAWSGNAVGFGFRISGLGFRVPGSGFRVSNPRGSAPPPSFTMMRGEMPVHLSGFRISGPGVWVPDFGFRGLGSGFRVPGFEFRISGSGVGFRISGSGGCVSDFGFRVLSFGFRISGCGFRASGRWNRTAGPSSWAMRRSSRSIPTFCIYIHIHIYI